MQSEEAIFLLPGHFHISSGKLSTPSFETDVEFLCSAVNKDL